MHDKTRCHSCNRITYIMNAKDYILFPQSYLQTSETNLFLNAIDLIKQTDYAEGHMCNIPKWFIHLKQCTSMHRSLLRLHLRGGKVRIGQECHH